MKHSNKPSVSGISNETFLKTESASSLQGSAEPNSPDTSISNGSETYPHKIDALKNWFRTRPIVEKFCALPTYIQSWGLTLFFMGTATIIAFCFFHALKNPTANIHSGGLFGSAFYGRIQLRSVLLLCRRCLRQFSVHVSVFRAGFHDGRLSDYLRGNVFNFQHYKRHHKQHENTGARAGRT